MKHIGDLMNTAATCAIFLGIAAAIIAPIYPSAEVLPAVEPITSYYGYKLVRLPTGGNIDKVTSILKSLNLRTWEISHTFADIMVPPEMLEAFSAETTDLTGSKILYEDLGVAIEKERQQLYASKYQAYFFVISPLHIVFVTVSTHCRRGTKVMIRKVCLETNSDIFPPEVGSWGRSCLEDCRQLRNRQHTSFDW